MRVPLRWLADYVPLPADPAEQAALVAHMPWVAEMKMIENKATAYVCRDFACDAPATDPGVFA